MIVKETLEYMQIEEGSHYLNCTFMNRDKNLKFHNITFEKCNFYYPRLNKYEFLDCHFIHCDFSNFDCRESAFYRCNLLGCKLVGCDARWSHWKDVLIKDSDLRYLNGTAVKMQQIRLEECNLEEASLVQMDFKDIKLNRCNINQLNLGEVKLNGLDVSRCQFDYFLFTPNENYLKGLVIDDLQASGLLQLFGVKCRS